MHTLPTAPDPLSKNSRKKQLKKARLAEQKAEKKQAKKEARKRAREEQADSLDQTSTAASGTPSEARHPKKRKLDHTATKFNATVLIDLAFDSLMLEKVCIHCCSPLTPT
jgi:hypothetical protein